MRKIIIFMFVVFTLISCSGEFGDENYKWSEAENAVIVTGDKLSIEVKFLRSDLLSVKYKDERALIEDTFPIMIFKPLDVAYRIKERKEQLEIVSDDLRLVFSKSPLSFRVYDKNDKLLISQSAIAYEMIGDSTRMSFKVQAGDRFFGMGQKSIDVDRKGYSFDTKNIHIGGYTKPYATQQVNTTYIYSPLGYGLLFNTIYPGYFDLAKSDSTAWSFQTGGGLYHFIVTSGSDLQDLQKDYYDLTGYPPMPPKWAMGLLQSKCAYETDTQVYRIVNTFLEKKLPIDAIILDAYWFGGYKPGFPKKMGDFKWLKQNFPDHKKYLDSLQSVGINTILINEPYINNTADNFNFLKEKKWLVCKKGDSIPHVFSPFWAGDAALFDVTNPEARDWLWLQFKPLIADGVNGLWLDLTEPEHPVPGGDFYLGSDFKVHNLYNFLVSQLIAEGYEKDFPQKRVFNLTRAGYTGMQRFGAINWSGDASKTWNAFKLQVPMLIGSAMSGMPHYSSDIGGFTNAHDRRDGMTIFTNYDGKGVLTTPELFVRWYQFGVFSPMLRPHSGEEQYCEPFAHGAEAEKITSDLLRWRYRMIPYIYTYAYKTSTQAEQLIKALFEVYDDEACKNIYDQYLFGEFLVAPVLEEGARTRKLYLPDLNGKKWLSFWNPAESYQGGQFIEINVDLTSIPVFVPQGSILPLAMPSQNTSSMKDDTMEIRIFAGVNAAFELYEDDGNSNNYRKGDFWLHQFKYEQNSSIVKLDVDGRNSKEMNKPERVFIVKILGLATLPQKFIFNKKEVKGQMDSNGIYTATVRY